MISVNTLNQEMITMNTAREIINSIVPISRFNKGEAGKIFDEVTKSNLLTYKGFLIENYQPKTVNLKIQAINKEVLSFQKTNENLKTQRDLLLPRLMSGKLEVKG